jgi:outer membrane protein OmpU
MTITRSTLLGTSVLVGIAWACAAAGAAEVRPGGALDVTVSGEVRFITSVGDTDTVFLDNTVTSGLDFFNDTEVHFILRGKHDATGLEYGGTVEFEADTSVTANSDETWVFLKGGFGELRFGDEDGVADFDGSSVSAASVAVGTGGLDGDIFEDLFGTPVYEPLGTSNATKLRYNSPTLAGFELDASYTPNVGDSGDGLAPEDVESGDVFEGVIGYTFENEGETFSVKTVVSGLYGDIKDEDAVGGDDYWALQGGAVLGFGRFEVAGSYLTEEVGSLELEAVTAGVAIAFGPDDDPGQFRLSLNYGHVTDAEELTLNDNELDKPYAIILSADYVLAPGLLLQGDVSYFDNDVEGDTVNTDDDGVAGVAALALEF